MTHISHLIRTLLLLSLTRLARKSPLTRPQSQGRRSDHRPVLSHLLAQIETLASIRSGDDGKKLIALEFIDTATVVLILEYSYLNFGHYSLSPTDSLYLNI